MKTLKPVRRVLTALDDHGRSYIAEAGSDLPAATDPGRPGYVNTNVWATSGSPARMRDPDVTRQLRGVRPPAGGTVLRVIDYPPRPADPEEARRQAQSTFAAIFRDAGHQPEATRHPGMHITDTIDYAIVLEGEIVAIMDEGEEVLRRGDILIQRGTNHAWENRSNEMTRMAFILVDASGSR